MIWLHGGVSQLETWDPKPGTKTGGPFQTIPTSVPGIHICEMLLHTAQIMHRLALVRGLNTAEDDHGKGAYIMHTGRRQEPAMQWPHFGSVCAKLLGDHDNPLPGYIHIRPSGNGSVNSQDAAFLGPRYASVALSDGHAPANLDRPAVLTPDADQQRHEFRVQAANVLGKLGKEAAEAVPELLANLQEKKMDVQVAAANALVVLSIQGVPGLLEKVREADRKGKWAEPLILKQYGAVPADAIAALIKQLDNNDPRVRSKAVLVLGQFGTTARPAVPALTRALKDSNEQVRILAAVTLAQIERKPLDNLEALQNAVRQQAMAVNQVAQQEVAVAARQQQGAQAVVVEAPQVMPQMPQMPNPQLMMAQAMASAQRQVAYRGFFHLFISVVLAQQHDPRVTPFRSVLDAQMSLMGPEALPALVDAVNLVATHRLGFI